MKGRAQWGPRSGLWTSAQVGICGIPPTDLTDDRTLFKLLGEQKTWRRRAEESIELSGAGWALRHRTVLVEPLGGSLNLRTKAGGARVILPIVSLPKTRRIDLDIKVAGAPAYLLSNKEHGEKQAAYIKYLAESVQLPGARRLSDKLDPELEKFLPQLFALQPSKWRDILLERNYALHKKDELLLEYLKSFPGWGCVRKIDEWPLNWPEYYIGGLARKYGPSFRESPTENPLLALPMQIERYDRRDVQRVLGHLYGLLKEADISASSPGSSSSKDSARLLLELYADYGLNYPALAECVVPLDKPFMVETFEKRELKFKDLPMKYFIDRKGPFWKEICRRGRNFNVVPSREGVENPVRNVRSAIFEHLGWPNSVRQWAVVNDAKSNHINVRVPDSHLRLNRRRCELRAADRRTGGTTEVDETGVVVDRSGELYSYSPNKLACNSLWFTFKLRQTTSIRYTIAVVLAILVTSLIVVFLLGYHKHINLFGWHVLDGRKGISTKDLAVFVLPVSIATSLLLTRANSGLGMRINRRGHLTAAALLSLLWIIVILLFFLTKIDSNDAPSTKVKVRVQVKVG